MSDQDKDMPFLSHLEELRWRLVKSTIAILLFAVVIFIFIDWITNNIFLNMAKPDFPLYRFLCWSFDMCVDEIRINFQSTEVMSQFGTSLLVAFLGGFVLAFPYVFYQLWGFVKPGLKEKELNQAKGLIFFVSILFFMGIAFGYFVIAPLTVQFFGNWTMSDVVINNFKIRNYISVVSSTVFFTGLLFLLPVIIFIFSKLGIITSTWLKKYRKHSFVGVLILSAIITPPDLFTQIIVSIPIVGLYELGIQLAKRIEKKRYRDSIVK